MPDDVREEVRFHLDARTRELIASGLYPEAAAAQARSEFGDVSADQLRAITLECGGEFGQSLFEYSGDDPI